MQHPAEEAAARLRSTLAALETTCEAASNQPIVAGLTPSWDEEHGTVTMCCMSGPGTLLDIETSVSGNPRWLTLGLDLGVGRFEAGDVVGIVAEMEADTTGDCEMFIRTASEQGSADTVLRETLSFAPERSTCTALHPVSPTDRLTGAAGFQMLGIQLPRTRLRLQLHDLHLFVQPAAAAPRAPGMPLTSAMA